MNLILRHEDLESIELATAIWNEITTPKVDLAEGETPSTRLQKKKAPLWKRILRAIRTYRRHHQPTLRAPNSGDLQASP